jgi:hypothetical protein
MSGSNNYWPTAWLNQLVYIPAMSSCNEVTLDPNLSTRPAAGRARLPIERNESDMVVADPFTSEIKHKVHVPYPNSSGA